MNLRPTSALDRERSSLTLTCVTIPALAALLLTGAAPDPSDADGIRDVPEGFRSLVVDEGLTGWWGASTEDPRGYQALPPGEFAAKQAASLEDIRAHWRVEGGELINDGHGLFLTTEEEFGDFEFLVDYRTVANADSGIYLRGLPQVQIWDTTEEGGKWGIGADKGSGGLWNNSAGNPGKDPLVLADRPFGEWNSFRIVMVGERVTVWLNDQLVVDHARLENYFGRVLPVPSRGPIQLQTHGGEIRWRNVFVRTIESAEANAILRAGGCVERQEPDGFESVWNGEDFTGWTGEVDSYEVRDGSIVCREGRGGNLFTERAWSDFEVELEILLPPGGNNGLALRYPGAGDTAYTGMCELQVLDDSAEKFANLDPRQYHGSVYGQIAPHRGYQRPVGEWNHQRVRVEGTRITVELNGTRIVDGDVAAIEEFMYPVEKFAGRLRTSGHFGFAGHGDAVQFRAIRIRALGE